MISIAFPVVIQPFAERIDPEPKPNLLLAISSIFSHHTGNSDEDVCLEDLLDTLSSFNVIMPRKVLASLILSTAIASHSLKHVC
jgi:hypothetical protein